MSHNDNKGENIKKRLFFTVISVILCMASSANAAMLVDYDFSDHAQDADAASSPAGSSASFITPDEITRDGVGTDNGGYFTRPPEETF